MSILDDIENILDEFVKTFMFNSWLVWTYPDDSLIEELRPLPVLFYFVCIICITLILYDPNVTKIGWFKKIGWGLLIVYLVGVAIGLIWAFLSARSWTPDWTEVGCSLVWPIIAPLSVLKDKIIGSETTETPPPSSAAADS